MTTPLQGIRVVEWTQWQQGPIAGVMLADMGAEVIKIEERVMGDPARGLERAFGLTFPSGKVPYYDFLNRGKKSLTVDLKKERGRGVVYELVKKSDIFLHNFRPSVVARNGMDYEILEKHNPKLIYVQATGWGPYGPDADVRSFDLLGQARSGFMVQNGDADGPPVTAGAGLADQMGGIMAALGAITALLTRERSGVGQRVDSSQLGSSMWLMGLGLVFNLIGGITSFRIPRAHAFNPLWNHYKCGDHKWVMLAHLQSDRFWPAFCSALEIPHLEKDPRFKDSNARREHCAELVSLLDAAFATKDRSAWLERLKEADLIFSVVNDIEDLVSDPQVVANNYLVDFDHPTFGKIKYPGIPITFFSTPAHIQGPGPEFGQHTEEVLNGVLGYSFEHIARLRAEEVV